MEQHLTSMKSNEFNPTLPLLFVQFGKNRIFSASRKRGILDYGEFVMKDRMTRWGGGDRVATFGSSAFPSRTAAAGSAKPLDTSGSSPFVWVCQLCSFIVFLIEWQYLLWMPKTIRKPFQNKSSGSMKRKYCVKYATLTLSTKWQSAK